MKNSLCKSTVILWKHLWLKVLSTCKTTNTIATKRGETKTPEEVFGGHPRVAQGRKGGGTEVRGSCREGSSSTQ